MPDRSGFDEDLARLAAESFELSKSLCRACGQVHALWPYIRLARASTGVEAPSSHLRSVLTGLIAEGRRRVLIAGAADTGLLALLARAGADAGCDADIAVLDRCEAPLALCRRWAARASQRIVTLQQDLRDLDEAQRFDLVLVHGTLHFIAAAERADVLARLGRSLAYGGRLVLLFNTSAPVVGDLTRLGRDSYADWVLDELTRMTVALPEPRDAFRARLIDHAAERENREGAFGVPEDVNSLLSTAGFTLQERVEVGVQTAGAVQRFLAKIRKRRFLIIAAPHAATQSSSKPPMAPGSLS
jgi:SAM-dependent methyltransferase